MPAAWRIEFYRDERGRPPVEEFLGSLQPGMRAKVARNLELLEEFGSDLGMPLVRPVSGQRFWELRVAFGGDICRLFYYLGPMKTVVVLHGFVKKTRTAPAAEIRVAAERQRESESGRRR